MTRSASSSSRRADLGIGLARHRLGDRGDRDDPQAPAPRAPRAISTGTAVRPLAEKIIITSCGPNVKLDRMTSASPGVRSMNIAWRWPFAPTTWVWNVIDSSTIGLKPGIRAVAREHLLHRDARVAGAEQVHQAVGRDRVGAPLRWPVSMASAWVSATRVEERLGLAEPGAARARRRARSSRPHRRRPASTGSQRPLRIER